MLNNSYSYTYPAHYPHSIARQHKYVELQEHEDCLQNFNFSYKPKSSFFSIVHDKNTPQYLQTIMMEINHKNKREEQICAIQNVDYVCPYKQKVPNHFIFLFIYFIYLLKYVVFVLDVRERNCRIPCVLFIYLFLVLNLCGIFVVVEVFILT